MIDSTTQRLIAMYMEEAPAPLFLAGFFGSPGRNFHTTEKVTIDIERDDEDVAIAISDLRTGPRSNESTLYTNKGFTPPIFDEEGAVNAYDLIKRQAGTTGFDNPDFMTQAREEAFRIFNKLGRKIRRAVELMASQVLQSGVLTLVDQAGTAIYTLDFQAKATHFPTAGTDWGAGGEDKIADLESLAQVLRRDGKQVPGVIVFGQTAFREWIEDSAVQARLDNRAMNVGVVAPESRGQGATFQGWVWLGHYRFEMWTYDGYYKDPQTGNPTSYVEDDHVIMMSRQGRLDLSFGSIPMIRRPEGVPASFLPSRMSDSDMGFDLTTNAYFSQDGKQLFVSAGTRPLTIPTAIDTFGALDTVA